jgi:luciferase family oxidoreductase group 1
VKLSIVDLSQLPPGGTASDAYAASVALAVRAEELGYHRYWVAEHHGVGSAIAGACPAVLMTRIAGVTSTMRVGSGTVLLNYTRPLAVAESFRSLHALFPGRIDLGIGRADSPPVVDACLLGDRRELESLEPLGSWMGYETDVSEVVCWLEGGFDDGDPRAAVRLAAGVAGGPEPWLLGSSPTSAMLAGRLGLRYGFASFFNPEMAAAALGIYRASFRPSGGVSGVEEPCAMLAVNVCCAETDGEADRLRSSVELFYQRGAGADRPPLQHPDAAVAELGGIPEPVLAKPSPLWYSTPGAPAPGADGR